MGYHKLAKFFACSTLPPDVLADGPRASQYTPDGGGDECHVTSAARIVLHPFLEISVSDFRKFRCTTHKNFRECQSVWYPTHSLSVWDTQREGSKTRRTDQIHPKTLFEIAMVLSTNSGSFPSNSHVSATFSILLRFGESWNPTKCEKFNAVADGKDES